MTPQVQQTNLDWMERGTQAFLDEVAALTQTSSTRALGCLAGAAATSSPM